MRFLLVLLAACSGKPSSSEPKITVVTPGNEPRHAHTYAPKTDRVVRVIAGLDEVKTHLDVTWRCDKQCTYAIKDFGFDDNMPPPTGDEKKIQDQIFEQAKKVHGKVDVKPNGWLTIRPDSNMQFQPSFPEILRVAVVSFPDEPIGIGAKWSANDTDIERTYTLVADDAVDMTYKQKVEKGDVGGTGHLTFTATDPVARGTIGYNVTLPPVPNETTPQTLESSLTLQ